MTVTLITCVTDTAGMGPGHSCIDVNGTIYSFETDAAGRGAGVWVQIARAKYLARNAHRPLISQKLSSAVSDGKVMTHILGSVAGDQSQGASANQAANAIEKGTSSTFNTWGAEAPCDVYDLARARGIVAGVSAMWPGKATLPATVRALIMAVLKDLDADRLV
jgi:hypothetical protein